MKFIDNIGFAPWLNKLIHILFYLFVLISLVLPFYLNYLSTHPLDYNKIQREVYLGHNFSGKVKDIFIDNHNRSAKTIKFYDGSKFVTNPFVMKYIQIGDSIVKKEKDSVVIIYKTNNDTIYYDIVNSKIIQKK